MIKNTIPLEEAKDHFKNITKHKPRKVRETKNWWVFRYLPPTKFEPKSFRTKVVNEDVHLLFGKLKPEHGKLEGRGLFDYFKKTYDYVANKASEAFDYIKKAVSIDDYSDTTKKYLQQYGDLPVLAIELRRQPLNIALELALQGVSKGKWLELKKKYGFDKFFHLSMLMTIGGAVDRKLRSGRVIKEPKKLAIEKLAVVSINENITIEPDMETQSVNVPKPFTIKEMFNKAREKYGDTRFFSYSALGNNNCQNFIKMLLEVMGLYSAEADEFVFQDISQLVAELPEATKAISQGITHLGALANKYLGVGGNKEKDDPCWEGYEMVGMKKKNGKEVPNCVPKNNKIGGNNKKMSLDDLYHRKVGGAHSSVLEGLQMDMTSDKKKIRIYIDGGYVPLDFVLHRDDPFDYLKEQLASIGVSERDAERIWRETRSLFASIEHIDEKLNPDVMKHITSLASDQPNPRYSQHYGGNRSAGFIRALMARDSQNPDVQEKWEANEVKNPRSEDMSSSQANKKKFGKVKDVKVQKLTKTTHDLLEKRKSMTRNQAIKSFYQYVKEHAPAHEPSRSDGKNFVGTYDLNGMYDQWKRTQGVEVREQRAQKRQQAPEQPEQIPEALFRRRPEIEEEPPRVLRGQDLLRLSRQELRNYLRGKTPQEIGRLGNRNLIEDMATILGVPHRRGKTRTVNGTILNIHESINR